MEHSWQIEREQLLSKLRELQEENNTLKLLLVEHNIELPHPKQGLSGVPQPVTKPQTPLLKLTPEEKISIFQSLFRGREDVFARRWYSTTSGKGGYQPVCEREWNPQYCDKKKYKCADCPNRQFAHLSYNEIYRHLQGKERSRSGNGAHVWIFIETPVLASKARKMGNTILSEAMNRNGRVSFRSYNRFLPNQDHLPEGGLGNLSIFIETLQNRLGRRR